MLSAHEFQTMCIILQKTKSTPLPHLNMKSDNFGDHLLQIQQQQQKKTTKKKSYQKNKIIQ